VIGQLRTDPQPVIDKAKRASDFILSTYTPQQEERDILNAWENILKITASWRPSNPAVAS